MPLAPAAFGNPLAQRQDRGLASLFEDPSEALRLASRGAGLLGGLAKMPALQEAGSLGSFLGGLPGLAEGTPGQMAVGALRTAASLPGVTSSALNLAGRAGLDVAPQLASGLKDIAGYVTPALTVGAPLLELAARGRVSPASVTSSVGTLAGLGAGLGGTAAGLAGGVAAAPLILGSLFGHNAPDPEEFQRARALLQTPRATVAGWESQAQGGDQGALERLLGRATFSRDYATGLGPLSPPLRSEALRLYDVMAPLAPQETLASRRVGPGDVVDLLQRGDPARGSGSSVGRQLEPFLEDPGTVAAIQGQLPAAAGRALGGYQDFPERFQDYYGGETRTLAPVHLFDLAGANAPPIFREYQAEMTPPVEWIGQQGNTLPYEAWLQNRLMANVVTP